MSDSDRFLRFLDGLVDISVANVVAMRNWQPADRASILVGRGQYPAAGGGPSPTLVLNNKESAARFGQDYTSVARLMAASPAGLLEDWTLYAGAPLSPADALARITLVVEDASPDSVIGILLVLMRLQGLTPDLFPADWVDAVDQWEREGTVEDPAITWTALAGALAHRHFSIGQSATDADNALAWTETLRFAVQCLRRGLHPYAIPHLPDMALWRSAQAALRQEEQTYLGWLPHAAQIQLSLPMKGANDRALLVDALLFTEDQPTGAAKVFYRNDRTNASLGQGFSLAAHYRPSAIGTGNDITIAVDPRREVHLKDLWVELEKRETAAWQKSGIPRPDDQPRKLSEPGNRWNEPWYLKGPEHDLIAAPRMVSMAGVDGEKVRVPGSRLTWREVREALWTVFHPLRGVQVHPIHLRNGKPVLDKPGALLDLRAIRDADQYHTKHLLLAKWPQDVASDQSALSPRSLGGSASVDRVIAGLIDRNDGRPAKLDDLPPPGSWRKIDLDGGFAILTHDGLFVLDDWRERQLDALSEICATFHQAAHFDHDLGRLENDEIHKLAGRLRDTKAGRRAWKSHGEIILAASAIGVRLADLRSQAAHIPRDPDVRRIREALDQQWGLDRRLTSLEQQVTSISTALKALGDARLLGVTRFVGIFGFGPYMANNLAGPLASLWLQTGQNKPPSEVPAAWLWWVCFFGLSFVIAGVLWLLFKRSDGKEG